MNEFICLGLGLLEICVALFAFSAALWVFVAALDAFWVTKADKIQFYMWLAKESKNDDNSK